jgi:hypothetical protein
MYFCKRQWKPTGLRDVDAPTLSRQSAHRWESGCQPYATAALYTPSPSQEDYRYSYPSAIKRLEELSQLKNPITLGTESATVRFEALCFNYGNACPFQFIAHLSCLHLTLYEYNPDFENIVK